MGKLLLWMVRVVTGLCLFGAGVGPKSAKSNISEWFTALGWQDVPAFIQNQQIDWVVVVFAAGILITTIVPWRKIAGKFHPHTTSANLHGLGIKISDNDISDVQGDGISLPDSIHADIARNKIKRVGGKAIRIWKKEGE